MSEKSRYHWGAMCDPQTASRVERAADTFLNGFHHRVNPLIGVMRLDAHDSPSVSLERADEYLSKMDDVLNYIKTCSEELLALNFDNNPQVRAAIWHIQVVALNGVFDATDLLKRECMESPEAVFSSQSSDRVSQVLENTVDYVDIAAGEPAPLRIQIEEIKREAARR